MNKDISSLRDLGHVIDIKITNIKSLRDFEMHEVGCVIRKPRKNDIPVTKRQNQGSPVGTTYW